MSEKTPTQLRVEQSVEEFGLTHWKIECRIDERSPFPAYVIISHRYLKATFYFDSDNPPDKDIRHEVLHLFHAEFGLYRNMAMQNVPSGLAEETLDEAWEQACERTVAHLERYLDKINPIDPTDVGEVG